MGTPSDWDELFRPVIGRRTRGTRERVPSLRAIKARAIVMPSRTDLYFPPEDSEIEVSHMPNAELRVLESVCGHRSAAPGTDPRDIAFFDAAIRDLLAR